MKRILESAIRHHQAGRLAEAGRLYGKILGEVPGHPEALNLLGVVTAQQGDLARGRALIEQAIAERPVDPIFKANLAQVWLMSGDLGRAEQAYRECLAAAPDYGPAWINLGNLMLKADRMDEARECFEQALRIQPDLVEGLEGLGFACQRLGRQQEAVAAFERAVALDPRNASALANLGGLLLDLGRPEPAIAHLESAIALEPGRPDLHTNLGVALHAAGRDEDALARFDASLRLAPGNARALGAKGVALAALGNDAEASAVFDHEGLIDSERIEQVPGYRDLDAFNEALVGEIGKDPTLVKDRAGKSTRRGSQTGELLGGTAGAVAALERIVRAAIDRYFAQAAPADHPYRPAKPNRYRLTAWATVLDSGGHQDSHNHPSGVLSGVYYVSLPRSVRDESRQDQEGCIEFGRPSTKLWDQAPINPRVIPPVEGLLLLFPSHFWHRTIPFEDSEPRISIAFDLIPQARPGA